MKKNPKEDKKCSTWISNARVPEKITGNMDTSNKTSDIENIKTHRIVTTETILVISRSTVARKY